MQDSQIPTKFPVPFANAAGSSYIRTIPQASQISIQNGAASLTDGFPPNTFIPPNAGGTGPFGQDINGILKQITQWLQWAQAGAPISYDATFQSAIGGYPKGTVIASATFSNYWLSLVDNNMSNPDTGGAGWQSFYGAKVPTYQRLTSGSGNYVPTTTLTKYIKVRMIGGGGGGGASGSSGQTNGGAGGNSVFGAWSANGGAGGIVNATNNGGGGGNGGSLGANGSGALILRTIGSLGAAGVNVNSNYAPFIGAGGGNGPFGGAGQAANPATAPGAGGPGGSPASITIGGAGGGGSGEYVEFIWSSPPSTIAYTVGAAGTAGTTSTGNPGFAGFAGIILIEEF